MNWYFQNRIIRVKMTRKALKHLKSMKLRFFIFNFKKNPYWFKEEVGGGSWFFIKKWKVQIYNILYVILYIFLKYYNFNCNCNEKGKEDSGASRGI